MRYRFIMIIGLLLIMFSGCAKAPTPENPVTLTVYGDVNRVFETNSTDIGSLSDFTDIHPEIKVRVLPEYNEWTIREKALQIMKDPEAEQPDIIEMPGSWVAAFAGEDLLLPIGSWYKNLPVRDTKDFLQPLVTGYKYQGELYGLPALLGIQYLYGRRDLLPESGLPTTLEELVSASRYIKEKHGIQGFIFPSNGMNLYKFYYTLLQIAKDNVDFTNTIDAHAYAFRIFAALVKENQPDYDKFDHAVAEGEFRSGRAGLSINGNYVWYLLSLSKDVGFPITPDKVSVGFLPAFTASESHKDHIWTRGYVINRRTKNPEQARLLLHHLTSERADFFRLKNKYILPARKSAAMYGDTLPGMAPAPAKSLYVKSKSDQAVIKINESPDNWYATANIMLGLLKQALAEDMEPQEFANKMVEIERPVLK